MKSNIDYGKLINRPNRPPCQICWSVDCDGNPCPQAGYDKQDTPKEYNKKPEQIGYPVGK